MTRKAPTGARHAPCITHVAHDYARSGWLCVTTRTRDLAWPQSRYVPMPATDDAPAVVPIARDVQPFDQQSYIVGLADHLVHVSAAHRVAELARQAVPALTAADYAEPVDHLPDGRPVFRASLASAVGCTGHLPYDSAAERESRAALAAAFSARRDNPAPDTYAAAVAAIATPEPAPVRADPGTEHVGVRREIGTRYWIAYDRETGSRIGDLHGSRRDALAYAEHRQSTTYGPAPAPEPVAWPAPVAELEPAAEPTAPDAMTICNGCGLAPMLPDNPAGYCADCERAARDQEPAPEPTAAAEPVQVSPQPIADMLAAERMAEPREPEPGYYARVAALQAQNRADMAAYVATTPSHHPDDDANRADMAAYVASSPEPVSIAPEPAPAVLAALPDVTPDGRPICERCGQVFRKHGTGAEWHRVNRPDCAAGAVRPSIAS